MRTLHLKNAPAALRTPQQEEETPSREQDADSAKPQKSHFRKRIVMIQIIAKN